jgi:flagellar basal body-associated protein FliL
MPSQDLETEADEFGARESEAHAPQARSGQSHRIAWIIVISMTVLFLLAVVAVVWGFVRQYRLMVAAHPAPAVSAADGAAAELVLAPGARILSASTDAGKLVLHVSTPQGSEVDIIDLATTKLTGRVRTAPAK